MAISGPALASVAAGSLFLYAGIKGKDIPSAIRGLILGKSPATAKSANPITGSSGGSTGLGSVGTVGGPVAVPRSQHDWAASILQAIGAPATGANVMSLAAWANHESPWNTSPPDGAEYTHNPLNTTMGGAGVVGTVNSVGVKIYDTWADGDAATIATLQGYPSILAALQSGTGLCGNPSVAGDLSRWSGGGYSSVC